MQNGQKTQTKTQKKTISEYRTELMRFLSRSVLGRDSVEGESSQAEFEEIMLGFETDYVKTDPRYFEEVLSQKDKLPEGEFNFLYKAFVRKIMKENNILF